jgi:hypothetical protein
MTLSEKVRAIYPDLQEPDFRTVIEIRNDSDGRGDYIAVWNHPTLAQPTQEQLDAVGE